MTKIVKISKIQMAALQSILTIQGVEYSQLVKEAFTSYNVPIPKNIPAISTLSYKEAIMIVKYGNKKFRDKKPS